MSTGTSVISLLFATEREKPQATPTQLRQSRSTSHGGRILPKVLWCALPAEKIGEKDGCQ